MAGVTVTVRGLSNLEAALKQFAQDVSARTAKAVLTRSAVKAGKVMADAFAEAAPKRSGKLAGEMIVSTATRQAAARTKRKATGDLKAAALLRSAAADGPAVVVLVGPSVKASSEASQLEFGAKPHVERPKKGRDGKAVEVWEGGSVAAFAPEVQHPGVHPKPFLRPAFEAAAPRVLEVLKVELAQNLDKAAKRAAARGRRPR